jgi:hypothetical protein
MGSDKEAQTPIAALDGKDWRAVLQLSMRPAQKRQASGGRSRGGSGKRRSSGGGWPILASDRPIHKGLLLSYKDGNLHVRSTYI